MKEPRYEFTKSEIDTRDKKNHRNTRHDAVEVINQLVFDLLSEGLIVPDYFTNRMDSVLMNLKERLEPLPEPIKQEPYAWIHRVTSHGTYKEPDYINAHGYEPLYKSPQPIQIPTGEKMRYEGVLLGLKICKELFAQGQLTHENIYENEIYYNELIKQNKG